MLPWSLSVLFSSIYLHHSLVLLYSRILWSRLLSLNSLPCNCNKNKLYLRGSEPVVFSLYSDIIDENGLNDCCITFSLLFYSSKANKRIVAFGLLMDEYYNWWRFFISVLETVTMTTATVINPQRMNLNILQRLQRYEHNWNIKWNICCIEKF